MYLAVLDRNKSTWKLRVFKIHVDGNMIKKKEIKHSEFLAEISSKKSRNPHMFKDQTEAWVQSVSNELDINSATKSLSPRNINLEMNTKNLPNNDYLATGSLMNHGYMSGTINYQDEHSPLVKMESSIATLKKPMKLVKR